MSKSLKNESTVQVGLTAPTSPSRAGHLSADVRARQPFANQDCAHILPPCHQVRAESTVVAGERPICPWLASAGPASEDHIPACDELEEPLRRLCSQDSLAVASGPIARLWSIKSDQAIDGTFAAYCVAVNHGQGQG